MPALALREGDIDVRARCQRDRMKAFRMRLAEAEGALADGTGRAEEGNLLHRSIFAESTSFGSNALPEQPSALGCRLHRRVYRRAPVLPAIASRRVNASPFESRRNQSPFNPGWKPFRPLEPSTRAQANPGRSHAENRRCSSPSLRSLPCPNITLRFTSCRERSIPAQRGQTTTPARRPAEHPRGPARRRGRAAGSRSP